jgi:hypothetical protein
MRSLKRRIGNKNPNTQLSALNVSLLGFRYLKLNTNLVCAAYGYLRKEWRVTFPGRNRLPRIYGQLGLSAQGIRRRGSK